MNMARSSSFRGILTSNMVKILTCSLLAVRLPVTCRGFVLPSMRTSRATARLFATGPTPVIVRDNYTALSFYKFIPIDTETITALIDTLKANLSTHGMRGTLLLANEGINGAFAVKTNQLDLFKQVLHAADSRVFADLDINIGTQLPDASPTDHTFPFRKLHIRHKKEALRSELIGESSLDLRYVNSMNRGQVLKLDCQDAGPELSPAAWHDEIVHGIKTSNPPIVLDCRNEYESDVGVFVGAQALKTVRFSETFELLDNLLADVPSDQRVLTYCTGGVRCVKVNAYLKQVRGMTNIGRLHKGIIHYENWAEEQGKKKMPIGQEKVKEDADKLSMFLGKNFVFDRRRLADEPPSSTAENSTMVVQNAKETALK